MAAKKQILKLNPPRSHAPSPLSQVVTAGPSPAIPNTSATESTIPTASMPSAAPAGSSNANSSITTTTNTPTAASNMAQQTGADPLSAAPKRKGGQDERSDGSILRSGPMAGPPGSLNVIFPPSTKTVSSVLVAANTSGQGASAPAAAPPRSNQSASSGGQWSHAFSSTPSLPTQSQAAQNPAAPVPPPYRLPTMLPPPVKSSKPPVFSSDGSSAGKPLSAQGHAAPAPFPGTASLWMPQAAPSTPIGPTTTQAQPPPAPLRALAIEQRQSSLPPPSFPPLAPPPAAPCAIPQPSAAATSQMGGPLGLPLPQLRGPDPAVIQLSQLYERKPASWYPVVGLYWQKSRFQPHIVAAGAFNEANLAKFRKLGQTWRHNYFLRDQRAQRRAADMGWSETQFDSDARAVWNGICASRQLCASFEEAMRIWASNEINDEGVCRTLEKAGWTQSLMHDTPQWQAIDMILKLPEAGKLKSKVVSPVTDIVNVVDSNSRKTLIASASRNMDGSFGRPTQVHGVPLDERAFDSKGNRLPWGLEWHPEHPNARGQKRHVEEKGPFGKSNRRKGSSRTRTATPAKKENPALDGFEKSMQYTISQNPNGTLDTPGSRHQSEGNLASQHSISANKQPTQVYLFGYSTDAQWDALDKYERASYGMICEDYDREPPAGAKRYPSTFSSPRTRRQLTRIEKSMAFKYDGGSHWVKVTFDSAEAAERAIEHSPIQSHGCWVYAQHYHGKGPEKDEPILVQDGDGPRQPKQKSHTFGVSSASRVNSQSQAGTTLPRSFTPSAQVESHETSPSSSTETSGTATGVQYPDLRQRNVPQPPTADETTPQTSNPQMMRHFPEMPRTVLRPASEALLPQPTWLERQVQWLRDSGLIPQEIIGNGIPLTEDGKPDLGRASFYWRFFYFIDSYCGTDFCGLKDEE